MKFVDALGLNTKENLINIATLLKISIPSRLRKKEYAMALAESFLLFPEGWLTRLTKYELLLLRKLVDPGAKPGVEEFGIFAGSLLRSLSIVFVADYLAGEDKVGYMIFDELREAIAPHIDNVLSSKEQAVRFTVEQYAYGLINLYGFLPYLKMQELVGEYLRDSVTEYEVGISMAQSLLIEHLTFNLLEICDSNVYVVSPFLFNSGEFEERLFERPRVKELKHFSKEEVFEAGRMPLPHFPCAKSDELKECMMARLGYTETVADNKLLLLWTRIQEKGSPMSLISFIIGDKLSSTEEAQEVMGVFVDYCNQCPRWFLKGYSATEAFDLFARGKLKENPPRLLAKPNMQTDGTSEMQAGSDNMLHNAFSEQKVGRNDPCPCGSGKKYKKCCGRN